MSLDAPAKKEVGKWVVGFLIVLAVGIVIGARGCCPRAAELAPATQKASAAQNFYVPITMARIDGNAWGGSGLGYTFKDSGISLEAQVLAGQLDRITLETDRKIGCRTYRSFVSGGGGSRLATAFSIKIPVGKR